MSRPMTAEEIYAGAAAFYSGLAVRSLARGDTWWASHCWNKSRLYDQRAAERARVRAERTLTGD